MVTRNSEEIGAYLNLGDFLRYRGYVLIGEPLRPAHVKSDVLNGGRTPSEVVKTILTQLGVWVMVAAREEGAGHPEAPARDKKKGMMIIYLLSAGGKPSRSSPDFARLLSTAAQKASENAPPGGGRVARGCGPRLRGRVPEKTPSGRDPELQPGEDRAVRYVPLSHLRVGRA